MSASSADCVDPDRHQVVQLRLLGNFELRIGDRVAPAFPYDKIRALLSLLVLRAGPQARERLADQLWPHAGAEQARANLRRAIFELRRCWREVAPDMPDPVAGDRQTIGLNPALTWRVDALEFERIRPEAESLSPEALAQHLALYRGPLLADLHLPDAPEFGDWLTQLRAAVQRRAANLLQALARSHEAAGARDAALAVLRQAVDMDPWCEQGQRDYLSLLARSSPAKALAHFEDFSRRLAEQLQLSPEPATTALVDEIRRGQAGPAVSATPHAERRRVLALVCDLEPAETHDPELAAQTLGPLYQDCLALVEQHHGHVSRAGNGELLAYFGHPIAREGAARHALEAALDLTNHFASIKSVHIRIGLHAGWTYVDAPQARPDTDGQLAKRARSLSLSAEPGMVLVSADVVPLGARDMQFKPGSGGAARLLGRRPVSAGKPVESPMVGRGTEFSALQTAWVHTLEKGGPGAVLLQGEPGLGKSRLAREWAQSVREQGAAISELACAPEFLHSPYYPLRALLPNLPPIDLHTRAERRQLELTLLSALVARLSPDQPHLLLLEDLHWCDPSTLELLPRVLAAAPGAVFLLCTSRDAAPASLAPVLRTTLKLSPLPRAAMLQLVSNLGLDRRSLPTVVRRADGVPLFAEELTRSLQQGPHTVIPDTLWDLLAARLDSLGDAKHVALLAALIGRDFTRTLLQSAFGEQLPDCDACLQSLCAAGVVQRGGTLDHYRFRHALIREAAYQAIPLSQRRHWHAQLAATLLAQAGKADAQPELIAQHLSAAGDPDAARYWLLAGRRGMAQSAYLEARHDFEAGLAALAEVSERTPDTLATELTLHLELGVALLASEGYGSLKARGAFDRALTLSEVVPMQGGRFAALWGLWQGGRANGDPHPPLAIAQLLSDVAKAECDAAAAAQASYALGNNHFFLGEFAQAGRHLQSAIRQAQALPPKLLVSRFGEDGRLCARAMLSWQRALSGRLDQAQALSDLNLSEARQLGHAHSLGYALGFAAVLWRLLDEPEPTAAHSIELLRLTEAHDLALWQAVGWAMQGWADCRQGHRRGLLPLRQAVAASAVAMPSVESTFLSILAEALLSLGEAQEALEVIAKGLEKARLSHERYMRPEFLRMRALALAESGHTHDEVLACCRQACDEAKSMKSWWWLLRSSHQFALHLNEIGMGGQAKPLLDMALAKVHTGASSVLVTQARQMLQTL